jgi:hypothetical protein
MFKTGNSFIGYFLMVTMFIPLVPLILVFVRRIYTREPMNFLLTICLLSFLEGFIRGTSSLNAENQSTVHVIFSLLLFLLFIQLFKACLEVRLQYWLNVFLAAFLSFVITYGSIKGWGPGHFPLDVVLSVLLAILILLSLPSIVQAGRWQVFRSPLFWIAGGTLFYLLLFLLLEWTDPCCWPLIPPPDPDKILFLSLSDLIRYLLYIVAVLAYQREIVEKEEGYS